MRRWFDEVWNQGREDAVDEMRAGNGVGHGVGARNQWNSLDLLEQMGTVPGNTLSQLLSQGGAGRRTGRMSERTACR